MSFGTQALFKWKGKSCPDGEASLCCLGHGDILVMDGHCHDEFLHCACCVPLDLATYCFLSLADRSCVLFANACAGFICGCCEGCGVRRFVGILGASWSLVHMGSTSSFCLPPHRTRVTKVCVSLDTLFGRKSVGALSA